MSCTREQEEAKVETPANFLANLGTMLRLVTDADVDLADILAKNLLTASPAADALVKAKDAILRLANERASSTKAEVANG